MSDARSGAESYRQFLQQIGASLKPDAIVIFTAHWEAEAVTISSKDDEYETIYDFYGFPDELYQVKYPAKGPTKLGELVGRLLSEQHIPVAYDTSRGLDHGSWTMLVVEFDDWLIENMNNHDTNCLFQYEQRAPHAKMAVPRAEHFVPLYIALGSGSPGERPQVIYRSYEFGTLSYLSMQF